MTPQEREKLGQDMIAEGQWAEYHQKRREWEMYHFHNKRYQEMMAKYHDNAIRRFHAFIDQGFQEARDSVIVTGVQHVYLP